MLSLCVPRKQEREPTRKVHTVDEVFCRYDSALFHPASPDGISFGTQLSGKGPCAKVATLFFQAYIDYLEQYDRNARKPKSPFVLLKPILGVLSGMPGQRHFRHTLGKA